MKNLYAVLVILSVFLFATNVSGQNAACLTWDLMSSTAVTSTTGNISGQPENIQGMEPFSFIPYTTDGQQLWNPLTYWPASPSEDPARYAQFDASPNPGNTFTVTNVSFNYGDILNAPNTDYNILNANVYYSTNGWTSPGILLNPTPLAYLNTSMQSFTATGLNVTVGSGQTFSLRINPYSIIGGNPMVRTFAVHNNVVICGTTATEVLNNGSICGTKFNDINSNGVQDNGEEGLSGWTINLTYNGLAAPVTLTTTTGADGSYCFEKLTAGRYAVSENQLAGWVQISPVPGTYSITLTSGLSVIGKDFGNHVCTPTINGTTPGSTCGTGTVTLGATASSGTINWYAAAAGGSSLGTGTSFTTPTISSTTTYYVDATDACGTTAVRTAVMATVNTPVTYYLDADADGYGGNTTLQSCTPLPGYVTAPGDCNDFIASIHPGAIDVCNGIDDNCNAIVDETAPTIAKAGADQTDAATCGLTTVTLSGNSPSVGTGTWTIISGAGGSFINSALYNTTFTGTAGTTYTLRWTISNAPCPASTDNVLVTFNKAPTITGTTPASRCGTGIVTLGATASAGIINWYSVVTGGTLLGTGTSFTTPSISSTTTYYVDATSGGCTTGARTAVVATVNALPVVSAPGSVNIGSTITLSPTTGGSWTSSDQSIASVTNAGVVTGVSAGTATFTFTNTITGCKAITSSVTVGSLCTDFEGGTLGNWQVSNTLSTVIVDGTNHYIQTTDLSGASSFFNQTDYNGNWGSSLLVNGCGSLCWDVNYLFAGTGNDGSSQPITVTPYIGIIGVNGLSATFVTNNLITAGDGWHSYCAPLMLLNSGDPLPSNANGHWVMAAGTTYADWNGILSNVARVQFGVDPTSYQSERFGFDNICIKNTGDCVPLGSICGMKFNDVNDNGSKDTGEMGLAGWEINLTYNLAGLSTTVTTTTGADGSYCFNGLTAGTYTLNETPKANWVQKYPVPGTYSVTLTAGQKVEGKDFGNYLCDLTITGTTPGSVCGTGIVTLGATASAGTINWYDALTGGNLVGTGNSYTTPSITSTTTYYAEATNNGCTTASRTAVTATVVALPTVAAITGTFTLCVGSTTQLADATTGGIWSSGSQGVATVGASTGLVTGVSAGTALITYTIGGVAIICSNSVTQTVTVNASPIITGTTPGSVCGTGTVTLGATASAGTINWYDALTGGNLVGTGNSYITPSISSTTTYYVDATSGGCTTGVRIAIVATVNALPVVSAPVSVNVGSTITLSPTTGGSWISNNPTIASVTPAGIVTGLLAGTATFTFTDAITGCSATTASVAVGPICIDFENGANTNNWNSVDVSNVQITQNAGDIGNTSNVLELTDGPGGSIAWDNTDFGGNWITRGIDGCLCFDYKVDWNENVSTAPRTFPQVGIYTGAPITTADEFNYHRIRASFVGYPGNPVIQDNVWNHWCLAIGPCLGGVLPSNSYGQWVMVEDGIILSGQDACDKWNNLITNVTGIVLPTDYNSQPSEIVSFDNFCWTCSETASVCDLLSATATKITAGDCCWSISLTQPSNTSGINRIQFLALSPNTFITGSSQLGSSYTGWLFVVNSPNEFTIKRPGVGDIPAGQLNNFFNFCLNNLSSPQSVVVNWLNASNEVVCSDTVKVNCDIPCVTFDSKEIICNQDNYTLQYSFTNNSTFAINKIEVDQVIPAGITVTPSTITIPSVIIGGNSGLQTFTISGATPNTTVAIVFKFTSSDGCCACTDTLYVTIPSCMCEEVGSSLNQDPLNCCASLNISNNYSGNYFTQVNLTALNGVTFGTWTTTTTSDWYSLTTFESNSVHLVNDGNNGFIPSGNSNGILNFCLTGYTSTPQMILVEWMRNDSVKCVDTLTTTCVPPPPVMDCVQFLDESLVCLSDGSFEYKFKVKNNSTHTTTGFKLNPVSPLSVSFSPADFSNVSIAPSMTSPEQTLIISGVNPNAQFCFEIALYEHIIVDNDTLYSWCCHSDTICITTPDCPDPCVLLYNTDFESPVVGPLVPGYDTQGFIQTPEVNVPFWETTASDNQIEIWDGTAMGIAAYSGNQFAELNCTQVGTLYQTFTATANQTVIISFAQMGRYSTEDKMEVSIGPDAGPTYTLIGTGTYGTTGTYFANNTGWIYNSISYTFPSGGAYRLRFESKSFGGSPAGAGGNFLDAISIICPSSICGHKFNDLDGDGQEDLGEPLLSNWVINLSGPVTLTKITDADGNYCFNDLPEGTYTLTETPQPQSGWVQTFPLLQGNHTVILGVDDHINNINFGNQQLLSCCDSVKVEKVTGAGGAATCCAKITVLCKVKAITVTVTNGTLSSVNWNCTTPVPTGYAGLSTYTFGPGDCFPEMTTCVNATAPGVVITYDIIFSNGETCRKSVDLECIASCCEKVKVERVIGGIGTGGGPTCCAKITATCEVKAITVTVTNGVLSSASWNCGTIPTNYVGLASYTFAANGCIPTMTTCVDATASGVVITYDIEFSNGETCRKSINMDCAPPLCCNQVKAERVLDADGKGTCCAKITATCKVKEITVTVTNGVLSSANWNCGPIAPAYVGQSAYTFAANDCVPTMSTCVDAKVSGVVTITYDIVFSNGEKCRKTVYMECAPPPNCCELVKVERFSTNTEGKNECCVRISSECKVKEVDVVIENGAISSTSWTCGTLPGGYAGQSNFTFAPNGCVIDMTNCIRPIKPGIVVVYYTIYFENGEKCEKKVELDCGLASGCVTPPSEMKAWWPLDETDVSKTGSISNDLAGFNNVGTRTNGPVPVPAMVLGGLQFDGIDDYVEVPDQAELNFGIGNLSFDAWILTTDNFNVKELVDKRLSITQGLFGYAIFLNNGKLSLELADGTWGNYFSPILVADGKWHHIAVTVSRTDPNGIIFYLDGVATPFGDPTSHQASLDNSGKLRIGGNSQGVAYQFKGILDEIELFNRVLTKDEIVSIFNAGSAGKCKPEGLLGSICGTKFNDLNGNGQRDKDEPGIPGWIIQLGGTAEMSMMTDKNGDYCFTDLEPGDYKVAEEIRKGWFQMLPASQGVYEVNLSAGQKIDGVDFGNRQSIILTSPADGAKIMETNRPTFEWLAPELAPAAYKIKIVEIIDEQSSAQAMLMNAPWYENTDIRGTSFTYPNTALRLEPDKLYGWLVDYFLGGQPISGLTGVSSEVRTFTIQGPVEPAKVSVLLQQPLPYRLYSEDLWNGTLTNLGGTTLKVLLTGTLEKTGTGKIVESTSGVLSLNPGKTAFFNTDFNTDLVNSIFDRWGNLIDGYGDYTACIQVKNESGVEIGSACIVQRVETPTSVKEVKLQESYNLEQNYPNPFNSTSTIGYFIPQKSFVKIIVYDLFGKEIKVLVNEEKDPGHHEIVFDRQDFVSGIYFYTLKTAGFIQSKKMILMK